jgi:hypothetical protein
MNAHEINGVRLPQRQEPMAAVSWHAAWRAWFEERMAHEHGLRPVHAKYPQYMAIAAVISLQGESRRCG